MPFKEISAHLDWTSITLGFFAAITLWNFFSILALLSTFIWNGIKIYDYVKNKKIKKDHE
jgi:hypothetical protein